MNEHDRFDELLLDVLIEDAPRVAPDRLVPEAQRALRDVGRRPRWLADLKEPPMRISSVVAAGSPAARFAALAAATILLIVLATGAVVAGASFLAGEGPLVVDPDDPNAYQTISEAVADAVDGDTVLVRPGTYAESVSISSDITVQGDGERGSVVVQFAADGPAVDEAYAGTSFVYGILLDDSRAQVANLTISGPTDVPASAMSGVYVAGGAPVVEDVDIVLPGNNFLVGAYYRRSALRVTGGSTATVRGSTWDGYVSINGDPPSAPTLEGNTITAQHIAISEGVQQPIIRHNTLLEGAAVRWESTGSGGLLEENDITGSIWIDEGNDPVVRVNRIRQGGSTGSERFEGVAIEIAGGATPLVEENEIVDSPTGILVTGEGARPEIRGNTVRASSISAISVSAGAAPTIESNTIEDNATGIAVDGASAPTLIDNTFCGNEQDLVVPEGSTLTLEGNTVCS